MSIFAFEEAVPELPADNLYWIAPGASVIGRVRLERNASVWFGAVARGDKEWIIIGENSNVQDGCILHTDAGSPLTIGKNCTIGHRAVLHGCTLGDNTLVGMGAIILNDARIGSNCLVGANALVTERKTFPDNSLVLGSPAKVVRTLKPSEVDGLTRAAAGYVKNWQRSEEHTSELQSLAYLVCRLLLEKKKENNNRTVNQKNLFLIANTWYLPKVRCVDPDIRVVVLPRVLLGNLRVARASESTRLFRLI